MVGECDESFPLDVQIGVAAACGCCGIFQVQQKGKAGTNRMSEEKFILHVVFDQKGVLDTGNARLLDATNARPTPGEPRVVSCEVRDNRASSSISSQFYRPSLHFRVR